MENYGTLTDAEAKYAELKAAAETPEEPATPASEARPCPICGKMYHSGGILAGITGFVHSVPAFYRFVISRLTHIA